MTTQTLAAQPPIGRRPVRPPRLSLADVPAIGGTMAAALGLLALAAWLVDADSVRMLFPGLRDMKVNTAICLSLMGAGVVLLAQTRGRSRLRWVAFPLVGVAAAIALITAAQYITRTDFGIDQLLLRDAEPGTIIAGRMSPVAACCIAFLGIAVFVGSRGSRVVIVLAGLVLAMSALSMLTFVFDAPIPPFLAAYPRMAFSTSIAMGLMSVAILGLLGPASPFAPLAGSSPATKLLRGALGVSIAVPLSMTVLPIVGQQVGMFDARFGMALRLLGTMAFGVIATLGSARWLMDTAGKQKVLEMERDRFFEISSDMLTVFGPDGTFIRANPSWERVLGYPADELVGRSLFDLIHPDDLEQSRAEARLHFETGKLVARFENRFRARDGTYRWLEWMSKMAPDMSVSFAVARDVTERKLNEERRARQKRALEDRNETLSERSIRDALTGLHNRRFFDDAVARLARRRRRLRIEDRRPVSVIMFDLDHFGEVNNQHGHKAGDAALQRFAELLTTRFRSEDLVARYGGEEFVAVLVGTTSVEAMAIADGVRAALAGTLVDVGTGSPIHLTVSAGCAQVDDDDVLAALAQADLWLSQAKRSGRNQVVGLKVSEVLSESHAS